MKNFRLRKMCNLLKILNRNTKKLYNMKKGGNKIGQSSYKTTKFKKKDPVEQNMEAKIFISFAGTFLNFGDFV